VRQTRAELRPSNPKESREFEFTPLRHRVPISRNFPRKSRDSARQRRLLLASGRGENLFSVDDARFGAKVSAGKFWATVWAWRRTRRRRFVSGSSASEIAQSVPELKLSLPSAEDTRGTSDAESERFLLFDAGASRAAGHYWLWSTIFTTQMSRRCNSTSVTIAPILHAQSREPPLLGASKNQALYSAMTEE
jgi:hypothetical protein